MRFNEIVDFIVTAWEGRVDWETGRLKEGKKPLLTICLLGPPGIGKTAIGAAVYERQQELIESRLPHLGEQGQFHPLDLTSAAPEDFSLPQPYKDEQGRSVLGFAHKDWLVNSSDPGSWGVVLLDDLPAASPSIQAATRQFTLFRAINGCRVSDLMVIIVTGNRREDKSGAVVLPAHFRSSVLMLPIAPDLKEFCSWYASQGNLDPTVIAYLQWRMMNLSQTPDKAGDNGSFATPRTWAMLGDVLSAAHHSRQESGEKIAIVREVACGLVGEGIGAEFTSFFSLRFELADPNAVLDNPQQALPTPATLRGQTDRYLALLYGIAEVTLARVKAYRADSLTDEVRRIPVAQREKALLQEYEKFFAAVVWVCRDGAADFGITSITHFASMGGDMHMLIRAAQAVRLVNPDAKQFLDALSKALFTKKS